MSDQKKYRCWYRSFQELFALFIPITLQSFLITEVYGAGNGIRTRDPNLGKVMLYH